MNHTCLFLPSRSWYSFTDHGEIEGRVGLGWLVGYIPRYICGTGERKFRWESGRTEEDRKKNKKKKKKKE